MQIKIFLIIVIIFSKITEYEYLEFLIKQNNNNFRKDNFKQIRVLENKDHKSAVLKIILLELTKKTIRLASQNLNQKICSRESNFINKFDLTLKTVAGPKWTNISLNRVYF